MLPSLMPSLFWESGCAARYNDCRQSGVFVLLLFFPLWHKAGLEQSLGRKVQINVAVFVECTWDVLLPLGSQWCIYSVNAIGPHKRLCTYGSDVLFIELMDIYGMPWHHPSSKAHLKIAGSSLVGPQYAAVEELTEVQKEHKLFRGFNTTSHKRLAKVIRP